MVLTPKKRLFAEEYLIDLNATQAALRAGYSEKTAYSLGQRLLKDVEVQGLIAEAQAAREQRTHVTQDRVLHELAVLDFSNVRDYIIDGDGNLSLAPGVPESAYRAIASVKRKVRHRGTGDDRETEIETEVRLWDKVGALRLTAKHLGMLQDRLKLESDGPIELTMTNYANNRNSS